MTDTILFETKPSGNGRRCLGFPGLAFGALALGSIAMASAAAAQDLAAERARVLRSIGDVKQIDAQLFPLAPGLGLAFRHEIVEPRALDLRLHFVVRQPGSAWGLQVRDQSNAVAWSTWDGEAPGSGFWSDVIPGTKATIEVFSSMPRNPLELVIDRIAIGTSKVAPVSIVGANQLSPISAQDDWIVELGRSVARVRFVADDGQVFVCTAFLITADLMFTNQHCIASEDEMESALIDFDFDAPGRPGETLRLRALLETDFGLDYSVIRLSRAVERFPLPLSTARPMDRQGLLLIQHPGGEPKQVSLADCAVAGALVAGRAGTPTDFGHGCDTMGGSSGSPVLSLRDRTVVGLHHLGISPTSPNLFNRATHMDLLLADLSPALRAEIEAGQ